MMLVAFRFSISFPIHDPDNTDVTNPVVIDVFVDPMYGFLTLMLGTMVSLVLSHIIVALHRYAEHPSEKAADEAASEREALCVHVMRNRKLSTRIAFGICIGTLLIITFVLVVLGIIAPSFSFSFLGAAGWFLEIIGQVTTSSYSIVNLALAVPASCADPKTATVIIVTAAFIACTMVLPLLHLIVMFLLWVVPMSRKVQRYMYTLTEVLNAWASIEVGLQLQVVFFTLAGVRGFCDSFNCRN